LNLKKNNINVYKENEQQIINEINEINENYLSKETHVDTKEYPLTRQETPLSNLFDNQSESEKDLDIINNLNKINPLFKSTDNITNILEGPEKINLFNNNFKYHKSLDNKFYNSIDFNYGNNFNNLDNQHINPDNILKKSSDKIINPNLNSFNFFLRKGKTIKDFNLFWLAITSFTSLTKEEKFLNKKTDETNNILNEILNFYSEIIFSNKINTMKLSLFNDVSINIDKYIN